RKRRAAVVPGESRAGAALRALAQAPADPDEGVHQRAAWSPGRDQTGVAAVEVGVTPSAATGLRAEPSTSTGSTGPVAGNRVRTTPPAAGSEPHWPLSCIVQHSRNGAKRP